MDSNLGFADFGFQMNVGIGHGWNLRGMENVETHFIIYLALANQRAKKISTLADGNANVLTIAHTNRGKQHQSNDDLVVIPQKARLSYCFQCGLGIQIAQWSKIETGLLFDICNRRLNPVRFQLAKGIRMHCVKTRASYSDLMFLSNAQP